MSNVYNIKWEMKEKLLLLLLLTFSVHCTYGQTDKLRQMVRKSLGSGNSVFHQATSIEYSADMGTVPEWHDCRIIVKKNSVRVRMTQDYEPDNVVVYDKTFSLTSAKYNQFITSLTNQSIRKVKPNEPQGVGGGSSYLKVKKGSSVLLEGEEGYTLKVSRGRLIDSFLKILPSDVAKKVLIHLGRDY